MTDASGGPVGTFCLVLHSHLPWLAHHGRWPVGEEWLYQSWAHAYLPVLDVVRRLAAEGRRDLAHARRHAGAGRPARRPALPARRRTPGSAAGCCARTAPPRRLPELAAHEHRRRHARRWPTFETHWRHGASPLLRALADAGAVELLGGPATHPFGPLLLPEVRAFALETGPRRRRPPPRRPARRASGRPSAATRRAWRPGTPRRACGASSSTAPRCAATRRSPGPSARPTSSRSAATSTSPTGCGPRARATRAAATTATSTPTTIASGLKPARVTGRAVAAARQAPLRPRTRPRRRSPGRRGLRVGRPRTAGRRCASGTGGPALTVAGVRHRALRPLVARGPGLAGGGAARAA